MWDSRESVYKIIKPPEAYKPRTPPPSAKELVRFVFFALTIYSSSHYIMPNMTTQTQEGEDFVVLMSVVIVNYCAARKNEKSSEFLAWVSAARPEN